MRTAELFRVVPLLQVKEFSMRCFRSHGTLAVNKIAKELLTCLFVMHWVEDSAGPPCKSNLVEPNCSKTSSTP